MASYTRWFSVHRRALRKKWPQAGEKRDSSCQAVPWRALQFPNDLKSRTYYKHAFHRMSSEQKSGMKIARLGYAVYGRGRLVLS